MVMWNTITISQYQVVSLLKETTPEDRYLAIICYLEGKKEAELPLKDVPSLINKYRFIFEKCTSSLPVDIEIKGQKFDVAFMSNQLSFGQYIDLTKLCKDPIGNMHSIMAVLCTKKGEKYQGYDKYEELFKECTMDKVLPLTDFFLKTSEKFYQRMSQRLSRKNQKIARRLGKLVGSQPLMPSVEGIGLNGTTT